MIGTPRLGLDRPVFENSCGFSTRPTDEPVAYCGRPSTVHCATGFGPDDASMYACDDHADVARALACDWHPLGSVCGVPDSMWRSEAEPGQGYCYWPAADVMEGELRAARLAEVLA